MSIHLVLAAPNLDTLDLLYQLLDAALGLIRHDLVVAEARSEDELIDRVELAIDDVILLDWDLAGPATPDLVRDVLGRNPRLRTMVLLPQALRQYRETLWDAGACVSIPKEMIDQEWMSTALCLMRRAIERETKLALAFA